MRLGWLGFGTTALAVGAVYVVACVGDDPDVSPSSDDGGPSDDGSSGSDDAGSDATEAGTIYSDYGDAAAWSVFDIDGGHPSPPVAPMLSYVGGGFDGRYVYFAPNNVDYPGNLSYGNTRVARYDTQAPFTAATSWNFFVATQLQGDARGYAGVAFDGTYVYFVPRYDGTVYHGRVLRYDRTGSFTAAASWQVYDVTALDGGARGFTTAVFAGTHLYFLPGNGGNVSTVARYDTTMPFTSNTSWTTFPLGPTFPGGNWDGGTFDGRYVYLVNYNSALAVRYDTQAPFTTASSWESFQTTSKDPRARGFRGGVFDGRYVYFVPSQGQGSGAGDGLALRYDTSAPFSEASSWQTFDLLPINANLRAFAGGTFDGRFVHFVPQGTSSGLFVRYDTTMPFDAAGSWTTFDTTTLDPRANVFLGGVFDGRFLYAVPSRNGVTVRFDAKSPPSLPPRFNASFF